MSNAGRCREIIQDIVANRSFCIYPWVHLFAEPDGTVKLCCASEPEDFRDADGRDLSLQHHSLHEVWNSEAFKQVRQKMIRGERIAACEHCYHEEKLGDVSYRLRANQDWLREDPENERWRQRVVDSMTNGFEVNELPIYYDLRLGNHCNLKCRMCTPMYSSLIARDPVHSRWEYEWGGVEIPPASDRKSRLGKTWSNAVLEDEILANIDDVRMFYFAGGEPLIDASVSKLLDRLIEAGVAHQITLLFSSNITVLQPAFLNKLEQFRSVTFVISIDGYGADYEYIRFPAKWQTIDRNLRTLAQHKTFFSLVVATVQIYNLFGLIPLFKYCEDLQVPFSVSPVYSPPYLSVRTLPASVKQTAIEQLQHYLDTVPIASLKYIDMPIMQALIGELSLEPELPDDEGLWEFMRFTNDLDITRGQDFRSSFPELYQLWVESGLKWTSATAYAPQPRASDP